MGIHTQPQQLTLGFSDAAPVCLNNNTAQDLSRVLDRIKAQNPNTKSCIKEGRLIVPHKAAHFFDAHVAIKEAESNEELKNYIDFKWQNKIYGYNQVAFDIEQQSAALVSNIYQASTQPIQEAPKPIIITSKVENYDCQSQGFLCTRTMDVTQEGREMTAGIQLKMPASLKSIGEIKNRRFIVSSPNIFLLQVNEDNWDNVCITIEAESGNVSEWRPKRAVAAIKRRAAVQIFPKKIGYEAH